MPFVLDTSSFRVIGNYYPDRFPSFWQRFDELVASAEIISVREVHRELDQQVTKDWLREWIKTNKGMFLTPGQPDTQFVREIFTVSHFQMLVTQKQRLKGMPVADPFVVACAKVRDGCVVTEESAKPGAARIPNVCGHFLVECTDLEGMLARLSWRF